MSQRYFEAAHHAAIYAKFRPQHPKGLSDIILTYLKEKYEGRLDVCLDVGCGNGQSSGILATSFSTIIATDISEAQVKVAKSMQHPTNIQFLLSPAEQLPAKDESVQLITAIQACHWFNLPAFFVEAKRLLCQNGVLVLAGYTFPQFVNSSNQNMQKALDLIYHKTGPYWGKGRQSVDNEYADISIPWKEFRRETLWSDVSAIKLSDFVGYITTWSGYQQYCKALGDVAGEKLVEEFVNSCEVMGKTEEKENQEIFIRRKYFLLLGRKE